MTTTRALTVLVLLAAGLAGCSRAPSVEKPIPVKGTVTLNGSPVPAGVVTLVPDNSRGRNETVDVRNGTFEVDMIPGKYKAAVEPSGKAAAVPAKYTRLETTDLRVEVSSGTTEVALTMTK